MTLLDHVDRDGSPWIATRNGSAAEQWVVEEAHVAPGRDRGPVAELGKEHA